MPDVYGASPLAWHHFGEVLGWGPCLLPVVSNPNREISPDSRMKGLGKTPSQINFRGHAAGVAKWTSLVASPRDIARWSHEPDHGICVQTGKPIDGRLRLYAFDIDVEKTNLAGRIADFIRNQFPWHWFPERYREKTGKTLLVFACEAELTKHVIPVEGGMIEMLGTGQQFVAEGSYISANSGRKVGRYLWRHGWPREVPELSENDFAHLLAGLAATFATGEVTVARAKRTPSEVAALEGVEDPVANWLMENWDVYDHDRDGRLFIRCPFEEQHTSDTGFTATAYFPAGTGGYERGHFDCKHAHCSERSDHDFREACGYEASTFPDLGQGAGTTDGDGRQQEGASGRSVARHGAGEIGEPGGDQGAGGKLPRGGPYPADWPKFVKDSNDRIVGNSVNVQRALMHPPLTGLQLAYDEFTASVIWAPAGQHPPQWRVFDDEHYVDLRIELELRGFKDFGADRLRAGVHHVAKRQPLDSAIEWIERLKWDGVERVETMIIDSCPGVEDRPYIRALSRYMWTALAGRTLQPGVKADMVPILTGEEGLRKSSWVSALACNPDAFGEVSLKHRDEDTIRKMRGKQVIELAELQGVGQRDSEDVKAFIVRQVEEWVPKYMEFAKLFKRRCLLFGTTNAEDFITERIGRRRWLPFKVTENIDVDWVIANREQLWAEAAVMFKRDGVDWSVEHIAVEEREEFAEIDDWTGPIAHWLQQPDPITGVAPCDAPYEWGTHEALVGALNFKPRDIKRTEETRAGNVLRTLGCMKKKVWQVGWRYAIRKDQLAKIASSEGSAL